MRYKLYNYWNKTLGKDDFSFVAKELEVYMTYDCDCGGYIFYYEATKGFIASMATLYYSNTLRKKMSGGFFTFDGDPLALFDYNNDACVEDCVKEIINLGGQNESNPVLSDTSIKRADIVSIVKKVFELLNETDFFPEKGEIESRRERIKVLEA